MSANARKSFVKNVNDIMERRGISQADIARELDLSTATVAGWCTGKLYPRANNMQRLADYLGATMAMLVDGDGASSADDIDRLEAIHQNPRLGLLFDRQRKMSSADIEFMLQMADRIVKERDNE